MNPKNPSVSLVIETNNLHAGPSDRRTASLERLLEHLAHQSRPLSSLTELVVTHESFTPNEEKRLERAADRSIVFVRLESGASYYRAKNLGFDATTADVVAFGDADCFPDSMWLERLLAPFSNPETRVVAGRTCYRGDLLGTALTTIDFMYFESPRGEAQTRNFYANNVAFRRSTFEQMRYSCDDDFYRGWCQVLGLRLQAAGIPVVFEPRARTTHRLPDSARDLIRLRLLRGADSVELTPHLANAYLPGKCRALGRLPGLESVVLGYRLAASLRSINRQDMPELHGARYLMCASAVASISALDGIGAGLKRLGLAEATSVILAYHENVDRLGSHLSASSM